MTDQPEKLDLNSMDLTEEKKQELLRLFPEIRTEGGKIDFERLKLALGETIDTGRERYGMVWPGKAECFRAIQAPSNATLLPCPEESINFDTTENLIIEGDNLEVLKLMQKAYLGKVKMIYIDPPYNTGNDFIYPDNYTESLQTYLEYTGQVDAQGRKFGTNSDTDGRFHSRWMNMMYPRLYLARNLLRDDGVIFISIDDNEFANLKVLGDSVFGEESFIGTFVWRRRASSALAEKLISTDHEYVLAYQKHGFISLGLLKEYASYSNPDNDPRGVWVAGDLTVGMGRELRPNQYYPLLNPVTGKTYQPNPNRVWAYIQESMTKLIEENRVLFPEEVTKRPMVKRFKSELKVGVNPASTWLDSIGLNSEGTREVQQLLGESISIYPKPNSLLKSLLKISVENDDLVLDFFAGSGSTAQAILELNQEDNGKRNFVLVQLPEPTERKDFPTIAEITKERVRRVIQKLNNAESGKLPLDASQDRGFRVFKLAESNFTPWNGQVTQTTEALARQLDLHIDHIRDGRSQNDILFEILLKSGFPLTTPVKTLDVCEAFRVFSVSGGALLICLDMNLNMEVIRAMAAMKSERVVCLDAGFSGNDPLKANAVQIFKTRGITFKTV